MSLALILGGHNVSVSPSGDSSDTRILNGDIHPIFVFRSLSSPRASVPDPHEPDPCLGTTVCGSDMDARGAQRRRCQTRERTEHCDSVGRKEAAVRWRFDTRTIWPSLARGNYAALVLQPLCFEGVEDEDIGGMLLPRRKLAKEVLDHLPTLLIITKSWVDAMKAGSSGRFGSRLQTPGQLTVVGLLSPCATLGRCITPSFVNGYLAQHEKPDKKRALASSAAYGNGIGKSISLLAF